jgi:hypothetical protein
MPPTYIVYDEKVVSRRTEILFIVLTILFCLLFTWRIIASSLDLLASVLLFFFCFFLFYSFNYRTLIIRLTSESLTLSFGIFTWTIALNNISEYRLDEGLPALMKYGGAGIHFMSVHTRYRASFNFLEHPRVIIGLKRKAGPVRDISFSTCQPNELIQRIQGVLSSRQ